jgi:hypothetical protein
MSMTQVLLFAGAVVVALLYEAWRRSRCSDPWHRQLFATGRCPSCGEATDDDLDWDPPTTSKETKAARSADEHADADPVPDSHVDPVSDTDSHPDLHDLHEDHDVDSGPGFLDSLFDGDADLDLD